MSRNSFATMPQPNGSRRCLAASRAAMAKIAKNSQCNQGSEEGITMPRGGSKPGERRGGRQPGSLNLRTVERQEAIAAWAAELNEIIPDAFQGDAHALLMAIYKNPRVAPAVRLDAAAKALAYEKPRLASMEVTQRSLDDLSPTEFLELWGKLEAMVGAGDAAAGDASAGAQERTELRALQSGQGGKSGQAHLLLRCDPAPRVPLSLRISHAGHCSVTRNARRTLHRDAKRTICDQRS